MVLRAGFHGTVGQPSAQVIDGSLKFDRTSGTYLEKTFSSSGNRTTWTWSGWVKKLENNTSQDQTLFGGYGASNNTDWLEFGFGGSSDHTPADKLYWTTNGTTSGSSALLRDNSGWMNIVFSYDGSEFNVWKNGELIHTNSTSGNYGINGNWVHRIGKSPNGDQRKGSHNISQVYFIDGQALGPEYFGFTDPLTNTWRPKKYVNTTASHGDAAGVVGFGTNGFYLPMDNEDDFEKDKSGQGNDWTQNNFSGTSIDPDVVKDSPSGAVSGGRAQTGITTTSSAPANYCIWNPLRKGNLITLSDGNLQAASTSGSKDGVFGTIGVSSGKYYWEVELTATDGNTNAAIGVALGTLSPDAATPTSAGAYFYSSYNGNKWLSSADSSYGDSYTTGDVVGVALDLDNTTLTFYKNGTSQGNATTSLPSGTYMPYVGDNANNGVQTVVGNWGQKPFKYAPPQGFLPLNYASVRPETVITRPDQYVGITTYTGTNASTRTISTEFEADLVWIKSRNMTRSNVLYDTVRGATKKLLSNDTGAEQTDTDGVKAFLENGVTIGNAAEVGSEQGYVMWHWKAGGGTGITTSFWKDDVEYGSAAAAGLDGGAINPAGASVGTKQGFSIIYQHDLTVYADSESSHGLSQTPDFIISKNRRAAGQWDVYHSGLTSGKRIRLNQTTAEFTPNFSNTDSSIKSVSSSTFTFVANSGSGNDIIHYIWHDVPGLQKFGSYTYTGNRPFFVELGFKPAVLWLKRTGSGSATNISYGSWFVADKERGKFNPVSYTESQWLNRAKASGKRGDGGTSAAGTYLDIDLVSNGFVIPTTGGGAEFNQPSDVVVYCAWAEAPASNLFGGQSTGR